MPWEADFPLVGLSNNEHDSMALANYFDWLGPSVDKLVAKEIDQLGLGICALGTAQLSHSFHHQTRKQYQ